MKVCLVVSDFSPKVGGIATFNNHVAAGLAQHPRIEHVLVIALQGKESGIEEISPKLTVCRMPLGNMWQTFVTLRRELAAARDYDVFHSPNVFPVGFFTLLIGRYFLHKPVVITFHGTDVLASAGSLWTRMCKRFTVLHADATTTVSCSTRKLAAAHYGISEERFSVVYYPLPPHEGAAVADIRGMYGYDAEDIIVLTVSNLVKRKGTEDLVRALSRLPNPQIKLLVVGDGPERAALEKLIGELQLQTRVRLAGRVADVDSFYHHADIFALTSYFLKEDGDVEGLGIVFLEAEQHGLPVIGTRSGGIPEAFSEGESGLMIDERDVPTLAACIEALAADPPLRRRMGERGKAFVAERFSVSKVVEEYLAVYKKAAHLL